MCFPEHRGAEVYRLRFFSEDVFAVLKQFFNQQKTA